MLYNIETVEDNLIQFSVNEINGSITLGVINFNDPNRIKQTFIPVNKKNLVSLKEMIDLIMDEQKCS